MSKEIHFLEDGYYVDKLEKDIQKLKEKCKQMETMVKTYKEVIEEVREYVKNTSDISIVNNYSFPDKPVIDKRAKKDLLQILDKAKEKEH